MGSPATRMTEHRACRIGEAHEEEATGGQQEGQQEGQQQGRGLGGACTWRMGTATCCFALLRAASCAVRVAG